MKFFPEVLFRIVSSASPLCFSLIWSYFFKTLSFVSAKTQSNLRNTVIGNLPFRIVADGKDLSIDQQFAEISCV